MPGKRILLVDYDPRSLTHTREVLEGAGFDVSTCGDGLTAIDQYKSLAPDLVLLSAMLPKMHGFEVCSNIRKLPGGDRTPVVIITDVYKGKRYRVDAINKYGATEYIEKPIEDSNLVTILRGLVKENGQSAASLIDDGERTVQFSRDLLNKMVQEEVTGVPKPSEKKTVNEKPKSKDEVSKKLEESLAGLDFEMGKKSQKGKPKDSAQTEVISVPRNTFTPAETSKAQSAESQSGPVFTSEDLFTDIIASVERELQSEKTALDPQATEGLSMSPGSPATMAPEPVKLNAEPAKAVPEQAPPPPAPVASAPAPTVQIPRPASKPSSVPKKGGFDSDMEKKLSNTLSGLRKPQPSATRPAAPSAKVVEPSKVTATSPAAKPAAEPIRKIEMLAAKVEEPAKARWKPRSPLLRNPIPLKKRSPQLSQRRLWRKKELISVNTCCWRKLQRAVWQNCSWQKEKASRD